MPALVLLLVIVGQPDDLSQQFPIESILGLVESGLKEFDDLELAYEGNSKDLGPITPKSENKSPELSRFQAIFAYRPDDVCHDYKLCYSADGIPDSVEVGCLQISGGTTWNARSIGANRSMPDRADDGGITSWNRPNSPFRLFLLPLLRNSLKSCIANASGRDPSHKYECVGLEKIDGRTTLKIRISSRNQSNSRFTTEYWLDLERGAHPIQCEKRLDGQLWSRIDSIELSQFPARGGREVWLPVRCRDQSFVTIEGLSRQPMRLPKEPVVEAWYQALAGTVRLDQSLPDSRFRREHIPRILGTALREAQAAFKQESRHVRTPQSFEESIDKALAATVASGTAVEVADPEISVRRRISAISYGLLGLGIAGVLVGIVVARRR